MVHAGETVLVRVKAATYDGKVPTEGAVTAEFWAPDRDPEHNVADRERPDHVLECFWDAAARAWTAQADTEGWRPGRWTVRGRAHAVTHRGPAKGWAWAHLELAA